jgi:hypothetical protein
MKITERMLSRLASKPSPFPSQAKKESQQETHSRKGVGFFVIQNIIVLSYKTTTSPGVSRVLYNNKKTLDRKFFVDLFGFV